MKNYILIVFTILYTIGHAQISGIVKDAQTGIPLIGASIQSKSDQTIGTVTNSSGSFYMNAIVGDSILVSLSGYESKIFSKGNGSSLLFELIPLPTGLEEIIVTGVMDARKRIESSIAITTLDKSYLEKIVPNSASELLRNIPGVFVQSARGELRNQVYVRGMVFGDNKYNSFFEDGLPILSGVTNFDPSGFIRSDVMIEKIEAVRGGSSSVTGANSPGGVFNFISKTGSHTFESEIRTRLGLEGNLHNPYERIEGSVSGPLSESWTYSIGGHYRHAEGAKYPGYALSRGGQVKGNILKKYDKGSLKVYFKYLNDRTKDFEFTPTQDFSNPHPAGSFENYSSVLIKDLDVHIPSNGEGIRALDYNSKDLNHLSDNSIGAFWEHRITESFKSTTAIKYSQKRSVDVGTFIVYPSDLTSFLFNLIILGNVGKFGTYTYKNAVTGRSYGSILHDPSTFDFTGNLTLPGKDVISNGVFFTPLYYWDNKLNDLFFQQTFTKQLNRLKLIGGYYANKSHFSNYDAHTGAGLSLSTIEDKPQPLVVEYTPLFGGPTEMVTDKKGVAQYNTGPTTGSQNLINTFHQSAFAGANWDLTDKIHFDVGFRNEWLHFKNTYRYTQDIGTSSTGGADKNLLTQYDNGTITLTPSETYTKNASAISYSAGVNFNLNKQLAFYVRFSKGAKVPTIDTYLSSQTNHLISNDINQKTIQWEGGVKWQNQNTRLSINPFISYLLDVPSTGFSQDTNRVFYQFPVLYNKFHTKGIELEINQRITSSFSLRANGVIQKYTSDKYNIWDGGMLGKQDDKIVDLVRPDASIFAPSYIFNISPWYENKKWYAGLNYYTIARRSVNPDNAFYLPAYSQFDLNIQYKISQSASIKLSVNNIFNKFGVIEATAPIQDGVFFTTFNISTLTKEFVQKNSNAVYYTMGIQARSAFLDFIIKL